MNRGQANTDFHKSRPRKSKKKRGVFKLTPKKIKAMNKLLPHDWTPVLSAPPDDQDIDEEFMRV